MRAVTFAETGPSSVLRLTNEPDPSPGPAQALVKLDYAGVNFIDTYYRSGLYPRPLPSIVGREGAGTIVSLGADVPASYGLSVGDKVAVYDDGTMAELVATNADKLLKLPSGMSTRDGAALMCQGLTAWTLVRDAHEVKEGEFVLVQAAAGGTGGLIVQMAKALGATVIGTVSTEGKAEVARANGADHVIKYTEADVLKEVMRITDGQGCHAVFSGVGKDTFEADLECTRRKGTFVTFGNSSGAVEGFKPLVLGKKNVKLLRPRVDPYIATREEFVTRSQELLDLIAQGKVKVVISKEYDMDQVAQAQDDLTGKKTTGKLIIKIASS